jgi:spore coat protein A, manganese oxidase
MEVIVLTRRSFFKYTAMAGVSFAALRLAQGGVPAASAGVARRSQSKRARWRAATPAVVLDPTSIAKFQEPLIIPPAMPRHSEITLPDETKADYYEIAVRQFQQQVLPPGLPKTTVWSFGAADDPGTFNYPAFTIEAKVDRPVRVKWINDLKDPFTGKFLPHLLAVDQTLHWANPPGPRDGHNMSKAPYKGPVPWVTHVHGAHTTDESDGFTEAWYLPDANDIPPEFFRKGTWYDFFRRQFFLKWGVAWEPGTSVFQYPNRQRPTSLWYHDHVLGMTRLNVYAGPAGFYLLRGGPQDLPEGTLPGPAPALGDAAGTRYFEIPLAIQDRTFNSDGSLFYPDNRAFFEGLPPGDLQIPFHPDPACEGPSDVAPIWNPEFFGNTMVVNGRTWPYLEVEQRRYRFRLLNGCNSRFLILQLEGEMPFWVIGTEGGFLSEAVQVTELLIGPAERYDVIIDFGQAAVGQRLVLHNLAPDEPFGGGRPGIDFAPADPTSTGLVMEFRVVERTGEDMSTPPANLVLPALQALGPAEHTRRVSLNEEDSRTVLVEEEDGRIVLGCENGQPFGPVEATLGTVDQDGQPQSLGWNDPVTENVALNATEIWEIWNFTMDAHPIHIHEIMFEVVNREVFSADHGGMVGHVDPPETWEKGQKDTVIAYPGQITRVKGKFDLPGLYVWHCHIVEHEDNEMMRPYVIGSVPAEHRIFMPQINR